MRNKRALAFWLKLDVDALNEKIHWIQRENGLIILWIYYESCQFEGRNKQRILIENSLEVRKQVFINSIQKGWYIDQRLYRAKTKYFEFCNQSHQKYFLLFWWFIQFCIKFTVYLMKINIIGFLTILFRPDQSRRNGS